MAKANAIFGIKQVLGNLKTKRDSMAKGTSTGLRLAGLALQKMSQKKAPVEFGNLKASAFTRKEGEGFSTVVIVGYTAAYALFVHENVEMKLKGEKREPDPPHKGYYWDPQGQAQPKFLEEPARTNMRELRRIIQSRIK